MAAAGYDPDEAAQFWDRMSRAAGGSRQPSFLSTHPSHGERRQQLTAWATGPDVRHLYQQSQKPTPDPESQKLPRYDVGRSWTGPPRRTMEEPRPKAGGNVKFD
jgi:predicted Zn-dependent protease